MPLFRGKSAESFDRDQDGRGGLAMAYGMKKKAKNMAKGGMSCQDCASGKCMKHGGMMAEGGDVEMRGVRDSERHEKDDADMVSRIMRKRMSEGGRVANEEHGPDQDDLADFSPNEFDVLELEDGLKDHDTAANSGDELGDAQEDEDREDMISRIMKSRRMKDRNPRPA